jgi:hypothetical protein
LARVTLLASLGQFQACKKFHAKTIKDEVVENEHLLAYLLSFFPLWVS